MRDFLGLKNWNTGTYPRDYEIVEIIGGTFHPEGDGVVYGIRSEGGAEYIIGDGGLEAIKDQPEYECEYPCLLKTDYGLIVAFKCYGEGSVLYDPSAVNGYESIHNSGHWNMSKFKPFHGTITIEQ